MVVRNGADRIEAAQVVFIGNVVAVPGDHVEWRVVHLRNPQPSEKFRDQLVPAVGIFVARSRYPEISRVGKAIGADRPKIGEFERRTEILADVAASGARLHVHSKAQAARNDRDFLRLEVDAAELRVEGQGAQLRHDQQFAVGAVKVTVAHLLIGRVEINAAAGKHFRRAVSRDGQETLDKVSRRRR